jgi:hypothetical protein
LDAIVANRQIYFDGVGTNSGSLAVSIRMDNRPSPITAKSHFQVMQGVGLPEIKFFLIH